MLLKTVRRVWGRNRNEPKSNYVLHNVYGVFRMQSHKAPTLCTPNDFNSLRLVL